MEGGGERRYLMSRLTWLRWRRPTPKIMNRASFCVCSAYVLCTCCVRGGAHTQSHINIHTHTHTHTHTQVQLKPQQGKYISNIYTHSSRYTTPTTYTPRPASKPGLNHTDIYAYIYTDTYTYTHPCTYTHTYTYRQTHFYAHLSATRPLI